MQLRLRERRNPDSDRGSVHLADGASAVLVAQVLVFWCFARRSLRPLRALAQSPLHSPWATDPLGAHAVLWPWATDPLGYRTHVGIASRLDAIDMLDSARTHLGVFCCFAPRLGFARQS